MCTRVRCSRFAAVAEGFGWLPGGKRGCRLSCCCNFSTLVDFYLSASVCPLCSRQGFVTISAKGPPPDRSAGDMSFRPIVQRTPLQDYTHVTEYLTKKEWETLLSPGISTMKADLLYGGCALLGLATPSESTFAVLVAIFLMACEGAAACQELSAVSLYETLKVMKRQYRAFIQTFDQKGNDSFPALLPSNPMEFAHKHPGLYARRYQDDLPVSPPMGSCVLQRIVLKIPMRSTNMGCRSPSIAIPAPVPMSMLQGFNMQQMMMFLQRAIQPQAQQVDQQLPIQIVSPIVQRAQSRLQILDSQPAAAASSSSSSSHVVLPTTDGVECQPEEEKEQQKQEPENAQKPEKRSAEPENAQKPEKRSAVEVAQSLVLALQDSETDRKLRRKIETAGDAQMRVLKKPAAAPALSKAASQIPDNKWTRRPPQNIIDKFQGGCPKCRYAKFCTPSCWRSRGF